MDSHGRPVCADGHTQTARDILTSVLICVLMDSHGLPVCADGHTQTSCTHGHPVCADGQPRTATNPLTSCVCWWTPMDVLCVLNRQPTWDKITQTVHGKGQLAESNDQRADMCTEGQPRTSCTDTDGHTRKATDVLCVLADTHRRPVSTDFLCVLMDTHGRPVCADRHTQTSCVPRGPKSPKQSTGRASVLSPRTNVLICVLMDSHGRHVCADGHRRTHTDTTDSHRCLVCTGGHPRTPCPTWDKITQTVHGKGQLGESNDQRADMSTDVLCVLTDTDGHTRKATDVLSTYIMCVLTDSHGQPQTSYGHTRTATDVLCVLVDTHGRPVCTDQTGHGGQNHPNSPREGSAC
ncbi:unnamed protein product [Brassica rapa]|uniref:Uncharacterized protein n=1 Tax=Brassica campestris TaxID=3711 RepID=A0A8D9DBV3_BRACM|nr:unnamed protein product [Brassica rapa]